MSNGQTVAIKDICYILNGFAFKSENYVDTGIRIIRIANVQKGYIEDSTPKFYPKETEGDIQKYLLEDNDLLLSLTGNVGRVALLDRKMLPAALNQRVACLRLKNQNVYKTFLFHFLNSDKFENDCILASNGVAQKNLSTEWLKDYKLYLPPLSSQINIANIFSKIDDLRRKRQEQIDLLDTLIKSRFVEMFGDVIANEKHWHKCQLGEKAIIGSSKRIFAKEYVATGVPFYRSKEIIELSKGLQPSVELFISEDRYAEIKEKHGVPQIGDILMTAVGTLGKFWTVETETPFYYKDGNLVYIRATGINIEFFRALLEIAIEDYKQNAANGSAYAALPIEKLKAMQIVVPPIELQELYAAFLKQTSKAKLVLKQSLAELDTLKKSLMQKFFG